jgi:hypothetical protein
MAEIHDPLRYNWGGMGFINGGWLMNGEYSALIKKVGRWWIGWVEEVPGVNCQERTRVKLMGSLRTTLREALEFNRQEALQAAAPRFTEEVIRV